MQLGFIGLGAMGLPMTRHLLEAGHQVTVASRSRGPDRCRRGAGRHRGRFAGGGGRRQRGGDPLRAQLPRGGGGGGRHAARPGAGQDGGRLLDHRPRGGAGPARAGGGHRRPVPRGTALGGHGRRREGHADPDGRRRRRHLGGRSDRRSSPSPTWSSTSAVPAWARWSSSATT